LFCPVAEDAETASPAQINAAVRIFMAGRSSGLFGI
jgi:hypothetical protein